MLTGTEILADFMKLMLLLGVICKRISSITEGVEECVIIQDKFGKSAVARRKHQFQLISCAKVVRGFVVSTFLLYIDKSRSVL